MARGPAYPFIDLGGAVELLRKLYDYAKRSPANVDAAAKDAWNWSPTSSTPTKAVAALKYFGLVEDAGKDHKSIKITDRGFRILVDLPESAERKQAIKNAALSPSQYAYCFKQWGAELPAAARSSLMIERGFVPSTVDGFLKDYKKTMDFAGLTGQPAEEEVAEENPPNPAATNGVKYTEQPTTPAAGVSPPSHARAIPEGVAMRQDVFSIEEGVVTIQWPASLSKDSLKDVEDWLEIIKRKLARSLKELSRDDEN